MDDLSLQASLHRPVHRIARTLTRHPAPPPATCSPSHHAADSDALHRPDDSDALHHATQTLYTTARASTSPRHGEHVPQHLTTQHTSPPIGPGHSPAPDSDGPDFTPTHRPVPTPRTAPRHGARPARPDCHHGAAPGACATRSPIVDVLAQHPAGAGTFDRWARSTGGHGSDQGGDAYLGYGKPLTDPGTSPSPSTEGLPWPPEGDPTGLNLDNTSPATDKTSRSSHSG